MSPNRFDAIAEAFCCPKCRGRSAHADQATLTLSGGRFFPLKPGRFLVVTCTLCGYTEFYDLSVRATEEETQEARVLKPSTSSASPSTS